MYDSKTQQQFVELRVQGRSYARIAEELQVSKRTLIEWGRKFQFEIQNQRAIELEALQEKYLATREERLARLGGQLAEVEAELKQRSIAELSTPGSSSWPSRCGPSRTPRDPPERRLRGSAHAPLRPAP